MNSRLRILMAEKAHREKRRISLRTVAAEADVPMWTIKQLSSDKLLTISLDSLDKLLAYFDCRFEDLFDREEESGNNVPVLAAA